MSKLVQLSHGAVFWLTGFSGAGKTSVSTAVGQYLQERNLLHIILDGDMVRHGLNADLTFSPEDRRENLRRVAHVAKLFAQQGFICICSFITPFEEERALVQSIVGERCYLVHIQCSIEECIKRDVKGLYRKALAGEIENFTGISQKFDPPAHAQLCIDTQNSTVAESAATFINFINAKL